MSKRRRKDKPRPWPVVSVEGRTASVALDEAQQWRGAVVNPDGRHLITQSSFPSRMGALRAAVRMVLPLEAIAMAAANPDGPVGEMYLRVAEAGRRAGWPQIAIQEAVRYAVEEVRRWAS